MLYMKKRLPSIFVIMPAYKDPVLIETLREIFLKADGPDRVFVAVGAQYDDEIQMPDLSEFNQKNLRVLSLHSENRPGVYRLRHLLNKLYANEDYYMSIDSHTELEESWDTKLIEILENQPEYKCIISASERYSGEDSYTHLQMSVVPDILEGSSKPIPRLVMRDAQDRSLRDSAKGSVADYRYPEIDYLQAGLFFTRGQFAREIRWGQYWQSEQEEPFLSYETFMLGWTKRLMSQESIISHVPEKYYEAVYLELPDSQYRSFKDSWLSQQDYLPHISPKIWDVYMNNTGPFKVNGAVRTPEQWWYSIGLFEEYRKYHSHSGELF